MDLKLFKKSFPYICNKCSKFAHTLYDHCDKCGAENALRKAKKEDYKKYQEEIQKMA